MTQFNDSGFDVPLVFAQEKLRVDIDTKDE